MQLVSLPVMFGLIALGCCFQEFEAMKTEVDMKEKELHELEEKLIAREQVSLNFLKLYLIFDF